MLDIVKLLRNLRISDCGNNGCGGAGYGLDRRFVRVDVALQLLEMLQLRSLLSQRLLHFRVGASRNFDLIEPSVERLEPVAEAGCLEFDKNIRAS